MLKMWTNRAARRAAGCAVMWGCAALTLSGCAQLKLETSAVAHAWVQADVNGRWVARAVTLADTCPVLRTMNKGSTEWNERSMTLRSEPGEVSARVQKSQLVTKPARFEWRTCETSLPERVIRANVAQVVLPVPGEQVNRIVLLGDTGCRMKGSESAYQSCSDAVAWPLAQLARSAAAKRPDLVIHVGDYHYRESPCPPGVGGCAGSPWGYGDDVWEADLFTPTDRLLAAAPWVFVRGNHESCHRAGAGWARMLDPRPLSTLSSCDDPANDAEADHVRPFALALSDDSQLLVFDSSSASAQPYRTGHTELSRLANDVAEMSKLATSKPRNLVAHHHPALAFAGTASGAVRPGVAGMQDALRAIDPVRFYPRSVDAVITGHFHVFEALGFKTDHPVQLVVGNGGSQTEGHIDAVQAKSARPAPGAVVDTFVTQRGFGFATLDRHGSAWHLTEWSASGAMILECELEDMKLTCGPERQ